MEHYIALGEYAAGLGHATESSVVFIPSRRSLADASRGIEKGSITPGPSLNTGSGMVQPAILIRAFLTLPM